MAATPIQTDGENITVLIIMTPLPGKMGEVGYLYFNFLFCSHKICADCIYV